jgi:AraC-like DNA-binding protein
MGQETRVPAAYIRLILAAAARRGVDPARLLQPTGVTPQQIDSLGFRLSAGDAVRVIEDAIELTGDAGLGLELGLETKPTGHGDLGFAAMSCDTLGKALDLVVRYVHLQLPDIALRIFPDGSQVVLESGERNRIAPVIRRFIQECLMAGLYQMGTSLLLNYRPADAELWFDWPEPEYFERFRARLPRTLFDMPSVQLRFSAVFLELPFRMADPEAVRRFVAQCERERLLIDPGGADLVERVRSALVRRADGFPDLDAVAAKLALSVRTLKRKLRERGYGYRVLLNEARLREARRMLRDPDLHIAQISESLGYSDPACFTRAFRRWSGITPSEARTRLSREAS